MRLKRKIGLKIQQLKSIKVLKYMEDYAYVTTERSVQYEIKSTCVGLILTKMLTRVTSEW